MQGPNSGLEESNGQEAIEKSIDVIGSAIRWNPRAVGQETTVAPQIEVAGSLNTPAGSSSPGKRFSGVYTEIGVL